MAVGITPREQRQEHLRQRNSANRKRPPRTCCSLAQRQQRRGHAQSRHAAVQTNLPANQAGPVPDLHTRRCRSVAEGNWAGLRHAPSPSDPRHPRAATAPGPSGKASTCFKARPMARLRTRFRRCQGVEHGLVGSVHLGQHVAELGEFGLDGARHLPDFAGAFFPAPACGKPFAAN